MSIRIDWLLEENGAPPAWRPPPSYRHEHPHHHGQHQHSHINTAMLLIPAILYLAQAKVLPSNALAWWVFLPASLFVVVTFMPQVLGRLDLLSEAANRLIYFFIGGAEFAVTLYLFWWAARLYRQRALAPE